MDWSLVLGFAAMAAVIEVSPGPNFLLIIRSVPAFGKSGAMAVVTGFACSYVMHGALAIFGVSALIAVEPVLLLIVQLAGACYLLYLGIKSFKPYGKSNTSVNSIAQSVDIVLTPATTNKTIDRNIASTWNKVLGACMPEHAAANTSIDINLSDERAQTHRGGLFTCFTDGLLTSALNPKISLFYLAAFPQFILAGTDTVSNSFMLVFIHVTISAIWTAVVALMLDYALNKTDSQHLVNRLSRFSGVALIGLSAAFFTSAVQAF